MTRKKDGRSYITVHDDMMNHPKIEGLSDAAKVHLVRLWGYCNKFRTDGMVTQAKLQERGKKVFTELTAGDEPMFEAQPDGRYYAHDYLNHQWSKKEIEEQAAVKQSSGNFGSHKRWHVARGIIDPDCGHCTKAKTG